MKMKLTPRLDPRRQRRRGFTLTEIAIVLGIIGLILGAIWVAAAAVYNNLRVSHANTQVLQIAQATRALYGNQNQITAGIITPTLINAHAVPSDMVNAAGTGLIDPFPSGTAGVVGATDFNGFVVVMTAVPRDACINLLMAVAGSNRDPGLYNASAQANGAVAAGDATTTGSPTTFAGLAITPTSAGNAAVGAAPTQFGGCVAGGPYKVRFGFGLKS